ncbi:hypothetical protein [Nocardia sp. NPDC052112]|uniref:hypothetical protein n=1 Tax=Nocardia sp. NPDC052112 TaxID=3155646 RepID=UPI0034465E7D
MAEPTEDNITKRGPSVSLLIVGLLALGVSIWAFIGPTTTATGVASLGWIVVITAIVVGILLVITPRRPR